MFKVIVERPRRRSTKRVLARLGMRVGYEYRELNENLVPLRRYLEAHVGRLGERCSARSVSALIEGIRSSNMFTSTCGISSRWTWLGGMEISWSSRGRTAGLWSANTRLGRVAEGEYFEFVAGGQYLYSA